MTAASVTRWLALAAVVFAAGCTTATSTAPPATLTPAAATPTASPSPTPSPFPGAQLHQVSDPGHVTGTLQGPCHTTDGGQLPDLTCTPGAYDPNITAATLCAPGYSTRGYRPPASQTTAFKYDQAYPAYGIPDHPVSELDHLVSLELAGSNDAANLWPEVGPIPNPKDAVENTLHHWVCAAADDAREVRLHEAQQAIAANWTTAEQQLGVK